MSRVLVVHNGSTIGGAELSLCEFLSYVSRRGSYTPMVACRPGTDFWRHASRLGVALEPADLCRVVRMRSLGVASKLIGGLLRANACVLRLIRRLAIDLIHANNTASFLQSVFAARFARVPLIWHIRDQARIPSALRFLEQWAKGTIAISRAAARDALWRPERAEVIHNGLAIAGSIGQPEPVAERTFDLLMVSQFAPWKRHEVLIRALAELRRRGRRVSAAIAGAIHGADQQKYAESLANLARELGVSGRLQFLGGDWDPSVLLRQARVLVHPAVGEPMGRVVGEAMCVGTPVVASRSGGIPEFVQSGKTGLLTTPDDVGGFADAIEVALDPTFGADLARRARQAASVLFDLSTQCERVLGVYDRCL
jgi:glycosyltransferase involved in cell wall biosynthesis